MQLLGDVLRRERFPFLLIPHVDNLADKDVDVKVVQKGRERGHGVLVFDSVKVSDRVVVNAHTSLRRDDLLKR